MIQQIDKLTTLDKNSDITSEFQNTLVDKNSEELNISVENNDNIQLEESSSEFEDSIDNENKDSNQSNCLALTVRKDYNLTIIKNIFTTGGRISLKVALSTLVLNFLRMFF